MFSTQHSLATLYLSGPTYANDLARNLTSRGFPSHTILAGYGSWEGQSEPAFVVLIIDETASPAHMVLEQAVENPQTVLMPPDPRGFESRIRTLAENLAADYRQIAVAWSLTPLAVFELTTPQATYKRHG